MNFENDIYIIRRPFDADHRCLMGATDRDRALSMLKYLLLAEEEGFTSFASYKACTKILNMIKANLALSLTSNDEFIRTLAENHLTSST